MKLLHSTREPIEDEAAFLEEIGIDPDPVDPTQELPEFMR